MVYAGLFLLAAAGRENSPCTENAKARGREIDAELESVSKRARTDGTPSPASKRRIMSSRSSPTFAKANTGTPTSKRSLSNLQDTKSQALSHPQGFLSPNKENRSSDESMPRAVTPDKTQVRRYPCHYCVSKHLY